MHGSDALQEAARCGWRGGTEAAGFADLAEAYLRPLDDGSNIFDTKSGAGLGLQNRVLDVFDVLEKTDLPNIYLLLSLLDEAAAGVGIVGGELLFDLADTEPIGDEFVGINPYLVLARDPAEAGDIDDSRDGLELLFERPVLQRLQFHVVVGGLVVRNVYQ